MYIFLDIATRQFFRTDIFYNPVAEVRILRQSISEFREATSNLYIINLKTRSFFINY